MSERSHDYGGRRFALLTRHGKERVIADELAVPLGATLVHTADYDTDLLGTFTGETPRAGTQLDAARRKAEIGMQLTGLPLGLASEGSFGPGPYGFGGWNVEIVLCVDRERGIEIVGSAAGPAADRRLGTRDPAELERFAASVGFPAQGLLLRRADGVIVKGLADHAALRTAVVEALALGAVEVETELRAFLNPARLKRIGEAARDLRERLASRCPACAAPGFGMQRAEPGLPCADCATPTTRIAAHVRGCVACDYERSDPVAEAYAEPRWCPACNP